MTKKKFPCHQPKEDYVAKQLYFSAGNVIKYLKSRNCSLQVLTDCSKSIINGLKFFCRRGVGLVSSLTICAMPLQDVAY
ncbi:hypothetical protein XENTR_v10004164 [Xenopus tropicalis]|nr:hypothetical protein XENTR_v10004164 [Xenopus tropicalis]KAE8576398.1 hypothetical protein XENTR_v10004164 [Xenopus tropicalis]